MYEYQAEDKLDSIEVTLAMGCRIDCKYCPQNVLLKKFFSENTKTRQMSFEDFKVIISKVKKGGTICFSGMCEPFSNPKCADMICYAYEQGFRVTLFSTLVGCSEEDVDRISDVEYDGIILHLPDVDLNSKIYINDQYLKVLKKAHEKLDITGYSCHGTLSNEVKPIVDMKKYRPSVMMDRAGNLETGAHKTPKGEIVCMVGSADGYGNWTPEVLPDGTVVLCCMDYGMKHILGNLITQSASEIINGHEYQKIKSGMKDETSTILCRHCTGAMSLCQTPAYHFKRCLEGNESLSKEQERIIDLYRKSNEICVYGLGKLFWNNFFSQGWLDALKPNYLSDLRWEDFPQVIQGVPVRRIESLPKDTMIILHMNKADQIKSQFLDMGFENVITIFDMYKWF